MENKLIVKHRIDQVIIIVETDDKELGKRIDLLLMDSLKNFSYHQGVNSEGHLTYKIYTVNKKYINEMCEMVAEVFSLFII